MQLGFVIDQERCIGCHACTVACKSENDVPVGNFRTWVKSVEEGTYPDVKRDFLVQRCNHCRDAPCVTICPVNALEKRPDGIVDLDRDACIGCRACMQACPYDALYLNDDRGAVEKCHFCAHRVERGLEPACVVVCPVNAIIAGDIDDPTTRAGGMVKDQPTTRRRPEQGTDPSVHYVGASAASLAPGEPERPPTYISSQRPPHEPESWPLPVLPNTRVVHDIERRVEWRWAVALYLLTKGIAGGVAMLAPLAVVLGLTGWATSYGPEAIALIFTAVTCGLLVEDLSRPLAFYRMLTRPNFSSWLVRGAVVLTVFGLLLVASVVLRALQLDAAADLLRWAGAAGGAATAGYTAFLFWQCKGRDLWESRLLLPHLLIQALACGAAGLLPFTETAWVITPGPGPLAWILSVATLAHIGFAALERLGRHPTDNARQAAAFLTVVKLWGVPAFAGGLALSLAALPLAFVVPGLACVPALLGLFLYEHAYVRAAQLPPLS